MHDFVYIQKGKDARRKSPGVADLESNWRHRALLLRNILLLLLRTVRKDSAATAQGRVQHGPRSVPRR